MHPIAATGLCVCAALVLLDATDYALFRLQREGYLPTLPTAVMWPCGVDVTRLALGLSTAGICYWLGVLRRRAGLSLRPAWAAVGLVLVLSVIEQCLYGDLFACLEFGAHLWDFPRNLAFKGLVAPYSVATYCAVATGGAAGWLMAYWRRPCKGGVRT